MQMGMIQIPKAAEFFFKENLNEIFESGNIAEGAWNERLCKKITDFTKSSGASSFCSNGAGLFTAIKYFEKYQDAKHIFIQSNTMYGMKALAKTSGLTYLGEVDCGLSTLMPSSAQIIDFLNINNIPKGSIFLLTHIGGIINPDIEKISKICKERSVILLEDCAHSLGATLNGLHSGLFGDAGVYSLYATKAVPAGEGGLLVSKSKKIIEFSNRFNIYDRFDQSLNLGINFRVSEVQALLSYSVCKHIEEIIENKSEIAKQYKEVLDKKGVEYIDQNKFGHRGNYYKFILNNVGEVLHDKITLRTSAVYDYALGSDNESIINKHICLPIWYNLDQKIIDEVKHQINSI